MFETRLHTAVFSRIDSSLTRLAEELTDTGVIGFDPSVLRQQVEKRLEDFFEEPDEEKCNRAVLQFGRDQATSPRSVVNALVWNEVSEILEAMQEMVEEMAKNEIHKLNKWMKINHGAVHQIKWASLLVIEQDADAPDEQLVETVLDVSRQVMEHDPLKLRQLIQSIPEDESGIKGFIRDLAIARLHDDRTEALIRDIMNVDDLDVIEELISQLSEQDIPNKGPLSFLATQVRGKLELIAAERELEQEEQEESLKAA